MQIVSQGTFTAAQNCINMRNPIQLLSGNVYVSEYNCDFKRHIMKLSVFKLICFGYNKLFLRLKVYFNNFNKCEQPNFVFHICAYSLSILVKIIIFSNLKKVSTTRTLFRY